MKTENVKKFMHIIVVFILINIVTSTGESSRGVNGEKETFQEIPQQRLYYVSTRGADTSDCGNQTQPCATVGQVLDLTASQSYQRPLRIEIEQGRYETNQSWTVP